MKKKILITGGRGFLGRNLFEYFAPIYTCVAPLVQELDLLDEKKVEKFLKKEHFDIVIHSAFYNIRERPDRKPTDLLSNNLRMFYSLQRCHKYFDRFFYFGSGAEYSKQRITAPVSEDFFDTFIPTDDYGLSKYIMAYQNETIPQSYCLSVFGCFGKYEDWWSRFISQSLCRIITGGDIKIHQNSVYDYLYIDDLMRLVQIFIEKDTLQYKRYNVCTSVPIDLYSIAKRIVQITGTSKKIIVERPGIREIYIGDNTRLKKEIGDFQFTPIDTAISQLYNWYSAHKDAIDPKKFV